MTVQVEHVRTEEMKEHTITLKLVAVVGWCLYLCVCVWRGGGGGGGEVDISSEPMDYSAPNIHVQTRKFHHIAGKRIRSD